jgi:glycosyltransferase involved in cell wall biosynthesis
MHKLIILPGACDALGGTVITLSLLIEGLKQCRVNINFIVLIQANSVMEKYLVQRGHSSYLQLIFADSKAEFLKKALQWVTSQPVNNPLLLDNCVERILLPNLLLSSFHLRWSGRKIYHFCHDLALSHNYIGYLLRKLCFSILRPKAICNSQFTAEQVRDLMPDIQGIMYQPVDTKIFHNQLIYNLPESLQAIVKSGAKLILTPSRITEPGAVNDKNITALISVLGHLKARGHFYHCVVIGQDSSPGKIRTQRLYEKAEATGVSDCFTILPPTFAIEDYYQHADVVVTLAPREPFGRIVVEAISYGIPVIGSCTGGIGEILSQFAPEWMVEPNDTTATAEAILRLDSEPNTSQIIEKGKVWTDANCSVLTYAQKMIEIIGISSSQNKSKDSIECILSQPHNS